MKYRFEITYVSPFMYSVNDLLSHLDLGFEAAIQEFVTFTINKDPLPAVATIKENLQMAFESLGNKVIKIEGGTLE
jgi:hypothetical protein